FWGPRRPTSLTYTTLFRSKPLHMGFGSIAPGNGVALGASFGTRHNPNETWRLTWSGDAVRSVGGSYRAGAYMRLIRASVPPIVVDRKSTRLNSSHVKISYA